MRLAVLWSELSGYLDACFRAAMDGPGEDSGGRGTNDLYVAYQKPGAQSPFDSDLFDWFPHAYAHDGIVDDDRLWRELEDFAPEVVLVSSWNHAGYLKMMRRLPKDTIRVLCMDNPWLGTPRQYLGVLSAPFFLAPRFDAAFVAGERQAQFARRLGFAEDRVWQGVLTCDHGPFDAVCRARGGKLADSFCYVGRLSSEKGVDLLVEAYRRYRAGAARPWPLSVYGAGPLEHLLRGEDGISLKGFTQPGDLPRALAEHDCLLVPSHYEAWGIAIHEAAAAGLSILSTAAAGATVHLVRDGFNGWVVPTGDVAALADAMGWYAGLPAARRRWMGENANRLSGQFTPRLWAENLFTHVARLRARAGTGT